MNGKSSCSRRAQSLSSVCELAAQTSIIQLVKGATVAAQTVLAILLIFSIASWTIIFNKRSLLTRARSQDRDFLKVFRTSEKLEGRESFTERFESSPLARVYRTGGDEICRILDIPAREELALSDGKQLTIAERSLRRAAMLEMRRLESGMGWLASTATASPFIGLFGTVVGIIEAFQGLSTQTQTSIQAVAPGIAEALVATAAGIFTAVPAYIAYNYFLGDIKQIASHIDDFILELMNLLERRTIEYGVYHS